MPSVRAICRNGQFRLLDPVDLPEGQEVQLQILETPISVQDPIGDVLARFEEDDADIDEDVILHDIEQSLAGKRPLSEIIIEAR